jgi:hypothetical protein
MITNALALAHEVFALEAARELILSAGDFVVADLNRIDGEAGTFCWSYSPLDRQVVLNATLKGSRLLAQAYALGGPAERLGDAARSAGYVAAHQAPNGAWPYAVNDARRWADNFHTGYVLECLSTYCRCSGDASLKETIARGWDYYRTSFFTDDMTPKYYDDRVDPLDATACAQAIITLAQFGDLDGAIAVAQKSIELLGLGDGSFAYQRRGGRTLTTPFLRWSSAWMYCGLAVLTDRLAARAPAPAPVPVASTLGTGSLPTQTQSQKAAT